MVVHRQGKAASVYSVHIGDAARNSSFVHDDAACHYHGVDGSVAKGAEMELLLRWKDTQFLDSDHHHCWKRRKIKKEGVTILHK